MQQSIGAAEEMSKKLYVYKILKERIVQNVLKPQEYLNEQVLCEELKVSKTPVREALQHLERDRQVVIVPNKGCFVSNISIDHIREVFEIREIFECAAARMAALNADKSIFREMLENHESFKVVDDQGVRQSLLSGYQIHERIVSAAGNSFLSEYYGSILDHIVRIRIYFISRFESKRLRETCEEHRRILEAIIEGKPDEAEKAVHDHLRRSLISIDQLMVGNRKAI